MHTLFIFPKRGLYHITLCGECRYIFSSPESDSNLIVVKSCGKLQMLDKYSQNPYPYPDSCPNCGSKNIVSKSGGIQELTRILEENLGVKIEKYYKETEIKSEEKSTTNDNGETLENSNNFQNNPQITLREFKNYEGKISVSTRLFDPSINYKTFDTIILLRAENITASLDYLVNEEVYNALFKLFLNLKPGAKIIFDTQSLKSELVEKLLSVASGEKTFGEIYEEFLDEETKNREKYGFPPFVNLLLFTSQEDTGKLAKKKIDGAFLYLKAAFENECTDQFKNKDITITPPYPAKILKRRNKYSYNFLVKYPRNFQDFAKLRKLVEETQKQFNVQVRLNPKHIF